MAPARKPGDAVSAGVAFALANVIISALQPVITRYAALRIDPLLFSACSVTVGAACCSTMLMSTGEIGLLFNARYRLRLFAISVTGTVATALALIYGLRRIDAVAAVLLLESEPVYSLVLATIFLEERPSRYQLLATATIVAAVGFVFGFGRSFSPWYDALLVLITPLFWQSSHVLALIVMPPLTPRVITGARYVYAAIVLLLILLAFNGESLPALARHETLMTVMFTGALVYFMGSFTWYGAISRLSLAWTTALVIPAVPIASLMFALIFLGERPQPHELAGLAFAMLGVVVLVFGSNARRNPVPGAANY